MAAQPFVMSQIDSANDERNASLELVRVVPVTNAK